MPVLSFDTETHLIRPSLGAPPMVTFQFTIDEAGKAEIIHARDPALRRLIRDWLTGAHLWNGHNVAYDLAVVATWEPDALPEIFDLYARDLVTDTGLRQKLHDLAKGSFSFHVNSNDGYSLAAVAERVANIKLDKSDPWRMKYGELFNTPIEAFPEEARAYALNDARAQAAVYFAQKKAIPKAHLADEFRQARAAWWLHLAGVWGMKTDAAAVEKLRLATLKQVRIDRQTCIDAGLVRWDGKRVTLPAMRRLVDAYKAHEEEPPLTDGGIKIQEDLKKKGHVFTNSQLFDLHEDFVKLDEDAIAEANDPVLDAFQRYGSQRTLMKRVERLYAGDTYTIQARYNALVETGRTSCSQGKDAPAGQCPPAYGFQLQNMPKAEGVRECFVPRPGFVFCSIDFDAFELSTWAQVCLWVVGFSRLAQVINAGRDPHVELGARLARMTKEEAYAIIKGERGPEAKNLFKTTHRQTAKIGNFGFPGGMGADALRRQARALYKVNLTKQETINLRDNWRAEWEEQAAYFKWVNGHLPKNTDKAKGVARSFISGRIRAGVGYTQIANNPFQGLAADAAKAAGFVVSREMYTDKASALYGSRIVIFAHDELVAELPEAHAHEAGYRMRDLMVGEARKWIPDVKVSASPALMRRLSKKADTTHDASGRLIPYEDTHT